MLDVILRRQDRSFRRAERLDSNVRRFLARQRGPRGRWLLAALASASALIGVPSPAAAQPLQSLQNAMRAGLRSAGAATGAYVVDLTTGQTLYSARSGTGRLPASVEKLYTTSTALARFGANATLKTAVRATGSLDANGIWHGILYLKGAGDPTFGSASYDHFAYGAGATIQRLVTNLIRQNGIKAFRGAVVGDESTFDSLRGTPATGYGFSSYVEGALSGLAYDRGFADEQGSSIQTNPPLFAAQRFVDALRAAGVQVPHGTHTRSGRAPSSSRLLATVNSPRMSTLVRLTNTPSDNFFAEMLLKDLGARFGHRGSSAAGAGAVRAQLASSFGIHPRLEDGSGLSRNDFTSPHDVVTLLSTLANNQPFVDSLAVAGESGTLQAGLQGTAAQGRCRGKTGSLHDVANLVGYCTAHDNHKLAFAFLMNAVDPTAGHALEDRMAVALANYNG
jgi:serine-type D-Ala-D-Ala carboxypeptidase/endopeptidase (penicillin-binding protein 4)